MKLIILLLLSLTVILSDSTHICDDKDYVYWPYYEDSLALRIQNINDYYFRINELEEKITDIRKQESRLRLIEANCRIYDVYQELEYFSTGKHRLNAVKYSKLKEEQLEKIIELIKN